MHKLQNKTTIFRYRIIALCFLTRLAASIILLPVFAFALYHGERQLVIWGACLGFLAVVIRLIEWSLSAKVRCPLCMTPVLKNMGCSKHRKARRLLGSFRLRVAIGVLIRDRFTCPYCNEPTAIQVREKRTRG